MLNDPIPEPSELQKLSGMMDFVSMMSDNKQLKKAVNKLLDEQAKLAELLAEQKKTLKENSDILEATKLAIKESDQKIGKAEQMIANSKASSENSKMMKAQLDASYKEFSDQKASNDALMAEHKKSMELREKDAKELSEKAEKMLSEASELKKEYEEKLEQLKAIIN